MRKIIYSIQGNIGSGKSTLLKAIKKRINNIIVVPEPIQDWQQVAGFNLLDKYYQDPVRWGFTFQSNCILSRMTQLSNLMYNMQKNHIYISQRSVQADKFIFAKLMHKLKNLNDLQYNLYLQMFNSLQNLFNRHAFGQNKQSIDQNKNSLKCPSDNLMLHKYIYLQTSPLKCFQRIKKRDRSQQKKIQYSYIHEIHNLHQQWLLDSCNTKNNNKQILIIDGQNQFQHNQQHLNQMIKRIQRFVHN